MWNCNLVYTETILYTLWNSLHFVFTCGWVEENTCYIYLQLTNIQCQRKKTATQPRALTQCLPLIIAELNHRVMFLCV